MKYWPEETEGRIPTKNNKGFMFLDINGSSIQFLKEASRFKNKVVDLGCAYGVTTLAFLQKSTCKVIAFDLSLEHLNLLTLSSREEDLPRLQTIQGYFPKDFNFQKNSLDAIHSSFLFHFLTGDEIDEGLKKCYDALQPDGKIFINTISFHLSPLSSVKKIIENNIREGKKWPGEIFDFKKYIPPQDVPHANDFFHLHDLEGFVEILKEHQFQIEKAFYYDIKQPEWFSSEGKGVIAVVARKLVPGLSEMCGLLRVSRLLRNK